MCLPSSEDTSSLTDVFTDVFLLSSEDTSSLNRCVLLSSEDTSSLNRCVYYLVKTLLL